jgi:hypothetical protein
LPIYAQQLQLSTQDHVSNATMKNIFELLSTEEIQRAAELPYRSGYGSLEDYFSDANIAKRVIVENDFQNFNLLRNFTKKITIQYFKNTKRSQTSNMPYNITVDDSDCIEFDIDNEKDLQEWDAGLKASYFRRTVTPLSYVGYGSSDPDWKWQALRIILESDKNKVFIWITDFGFYLGSWETEPFDAARFFYSPELAFVLVKYIEEHSLNNVLPQINYDVFAGKHLFKSMCEIEEEKAWNKHRQPLPDNY